MNGGPISSERDSFHQAMVDNPQDATPRLVYADWLEDHEHPELARIVRRAAGTTNDAIRSFQTWTHYPILDRDKFPYMVFFQGDPGHARPIIGLALYERSGPKMGRVLQHYTVMTKGDAEDTLRGLIERGIPVSTHRTHEDAIGGLNDWISQIAGKPMGYSEHHHRFIPTQPQPEQLSRARHFAAGDRPSTAKKRSRKLARPIYREEQALHQAIEDNPTDTLPPNVLADWYEDNNMPAHAEIVRKSAAEHNEGEASRRQLAEERGEEYTPKGIGKVGAVSRSVAPQVEIGHITSYPSIGSPNDDMIRLSHGNLTWPLWVKREDTFRLVPQLINEGADLQPSYVYHDATVPSHVAFYQELRRRGVKLPPEVLRQWHGLETRAIPIPEDEPPVQHMARRFAAYRAPAGGTVVRGTYYQGGKMIPDLTGEFANPKRKSQALSSPAPTNKSLKWRFPDEFAAEERMAVEGSGEGTGLHSPVQFARPGDRGNDRVRAVSRGYVERYGPQFGVPEFRETPRRRLDLNLSRRTADAFDAMQHEPHNPEVARAYQQLAKEIAAQYDYILGSGLVVTPWLREGQPYANSDEMFADVRDNNHLWFFPTNSPHGESFGTSEEFDPRGNPLLAESGHVANGYRLTLNDLLRIVHDYSAHAGEGNSFGPIGEYNAWLDHAKMFSPLAMRALTTETHGQNSWVNFGPHLRRPDGSIPVSGDPDYIPLEERPFADQKINLLPDDAVPPPPYQESPRKMARPSRLDEIRKRWKDRQQRSESEPLVISYAQRTAPVREKIKGGLADRKPDSDFDPEQIAAGIKVEMEHTDNPRIAREIAKDHLTENPNYYRILKQAKLRRQSRPRRYAAEEYPYAHEWDDHTLMQMLVRDQDNKILRDEMYNRLRDRAETYGDEEADREAQLLLSDQPIYWDGQRIHDAQEVMESGGINPEEKNLLEKVLHWSTDIDQGRPPADFRIGHISPKAQARILADWWHFQDAHEPQLGYLHHSLYTHRNPELDAAWASYPKYKTEEQEDRPTIYWGTRAGDFYASSRNLPGHFGDYLNDYGYFQNAPKDPMRGQSIKELHSGAESFKTPSLRLPEHDEQQLLQIKKE